MFKRIFSLVFAFVMMTALAYADAPDFSQHAVALADVTCEACDYTLSGRNEIKDGWYYATGSKHEYRIYYYGICYTCGSTTDIHEVNGYSEHVWKYNYDAHDGDSMRHKVVYYCTQCFGPKIEYYDCPGAVTGVCKTDFNSVDNSATE